MKLWTIENKDGFWWTVRDGEEPRAAATKRVAGITAMWLNEILLANG